jgi:hypothetical protein
LEFDNNQFEYLPDAIKAHLKRFPSIKNGLNELENRILDISIKDKPKSKKELLSNLITNQGIYGFGDTQYERVISTLKPLFSSFNPVRVNSKGKSILLTENNYYSQIRDTEVYLGGAIKYNYLYNTDTNRILKL